GGSAVVVGHDMRPSSPSLSRAFAEGAASRGASPLFCPRRPAPRFPPRPTPTQRRSQHSNAARSRRVARDSELFSKAPVRAAFPLLAVALVLALALVLVLVLVLVSWSSADRHDRLLRRPQRQELRRRSPERVRRPRLRRHPAPAPVHHQHRHLRPAEVHRDLLRRHRGLPHPQRHHPDRPTLHRPTRTGVHARPAPQQPGPRDLRVRHRPEAQHVLTRRRPARPTVRVRLPPDPLRPHRRHQPRQALLREQRTRARGRRRRRLC
ncbi:hypothetical protein, partial [Kitasatospora cineracea]|uniref:hypothetical protein n=1 Tax=Kitasatospora cineracea TaxID=88074 RepID=UPI003474AED5